MGGFTSHFFRKKILMPQCGTNQNGAKRQHFLSLLFSMIGYWFMVP